MKIISFYTLVIFLAIPSLGQSSRKAERFRVVDNHVARITQQMIYHPDILVDSLTRPFSNDYDKVRSIYTWIATNIQYDLFAFLHKKKDLQSTSDVLLSGKALCYGFSLLFQDFCQRANIKSEVIEGYAKVFGYKKGQTFGESNHAWNAVLIYGSWYLLDVTWATGDPRKLFGREDRIDLETYFLMEPEEFVKTHIPEDPTWQLLDRKISLDEFENDVKIEGSIAIIVNAYSPADYYYLNEYDKDIVQYLRARNFNPDNMRVMEKLSFAYLYKGISLTDNLWKLDYPQLLDSISALEAMFYAFMDSSWVAVLDISDLSMMKTRTIVADEINYQKGIFNYEIAAELWNKALALDILPTSDKSQSMRYFQEAEKYFAKVPSASIYQSDAKEYLTRIEDLRAQLENP